MTMIMKMMEGMKTKVMEMMTKVMKMMEEMMTSCSSHCASPLAEAQCDGSAQSSPTT